MRDGRNYIKSNFIGVYSCEFYEQGKSIGRKYYAKKTINGRTWGSLYFDSDIEAAKAYDLKLIQLGLEPVNILKRKI